MTLKELRISKGLSQQEAAKFLATPLRSFKRYENEKKYVGTLKYNFLFDALSLYKEQSKTAKISKKLNVVIAGIGFVGLSTALLFKEKSNVTLIDINKDKVDLINKGVSPIKTKAFSEAVKNSNLHATMDVFAYKNADIVIVATQTDLDNETKRLDTFSVENVVRTVREINRNCLIVIKSTLPVGFTLSLISQYGYKIIFYPEFLREKNAIYDVFHPFRIIFGVEKKNKAIERFKRLCELSVKNEAKVSYTNTKEAESIKLFSNAYLAMRIAFFNELDSFAIQNNMSSKKIIAGLGKDPRIGEQYSDPSFMFGGICLPKDTKEVEYEMQGIQNNSLINSILKSNEDRLDFIKNKVIEKAVNISGKDKNDIVVGIYNLDTHKNLKSYRLSSSVKLLDALKKEKIKVLVFDEYYEKGIKDLNSFINQTDLIVSNTETTKFKKCKKKLFIPGL